MKRQWTTIIALVLVILIAAFAVMNTELVPVNFAFTVASWPLIMVILGSLLIGALIAVLISTGTIMHDRKEIKQLKKEIEASKSKQQEEISQIHKEHEKELSEKNNQIQQLKAQLTATDAQTVKLD
ncbi:lipopolysaccharide assembly protein LapA domain-containing protein [Desemzia incerta]|uniref:LapA family protein n=2 Tax=Desemzia incerta TaxID=82801 RepID=UPI003D007A96